MSSHKMYSGEEITGYLSNTPLVLNLGTSTYLAQD